MVEEKKQELEKEIEKVNGTAQEKKGEISEKKVEEEKPAEKKEEIKQSQEKTEAVVKGRNLGISTKHSVAICNFIRREKISEAIKKLEQVEKKKKAVPMKGEIPHRKGGIPGRYPIKAGKIFIKLLKSLAANASINGLEDAYISMAKADRASRPYRRFGSRRFKRTNILLVARKKEESKKNKEGIK